MKPTDDLDPIESPYAEDSDGYLYTTVEQYLQEARNNWQKGFEPLNALPATWYNALMYILTKHAQEVNRLLGSVFDEVKNVCLTKYTQDELSIAETDQLLKAIRDIAAGAVQVATDTVLGGVKSSAADWKVRVDAVNGTMSVNTTEASTSAAGLMSVADKTKLNGIETGAQKNVTWGLKISGQTLSIVNDGTGQASVTLPSVSHAISATYLRPANSTSTAVTADTSGNLKAHSLELT